MADYTSPIKKFEITFQDLRNLLKRSKWLTLLLLLTVAVMGYLHFFGIPAPNPAASEKKQDAAEIDRDTKHEEMSRKLGEVEEAVKELKNVVVQGSKSLVDKIPATAEYDLEEGSLVLAVSPPEQGALELRMFSKTTEASLTFTIFPRTVQYKYYHPGLGTLMKEAPIFETDLANERRIIIVASTWTIAGHQITININNHQRA